MATEQNPTAGQYAAGIRKHNDQLEILRSGVALAAHNLSEAISNGPLTPAQATAFNGALSSLQALAWPGPARVSPDAPKP